ncbi:MAG: ATP-binding protein [Salinivirgaceae bacterium]
MIDKEIVRQVIVDQQNLSFKPSDLARLGKLDRNKEILVITGVRRCGKTTLLHELRERNIEKSYYLNFDDDRLLSFSVEDFQILIELFIELYGIQTTFYFDEIQNIEGWERFVRRLYDYGNKIYISGSNATMLSIELGTRLTGRYLLHELFPFSFLEYLNFNKISISEQSAVSTQGKAEMKSHFNGYFQKGGFPAYLQSGNNQYLKSLYESILYRDVMVRNGLTNERELLELVFFLASNTSKLVSYNSLTKVIGVKNATTVKNYLGYLQNTYLLFIVNKYDVSVKKQFQNPKKVYFVDLGLIRELGFHFSEDNGKLLENLVFIELKRRGNDVYYHFQQKECDFLVREKNKIVEAIQVSWSVFDSLTRKREMEGLLDAMNCYGLNEGFILTDSEEEVIEHENKRIYVKPVWKWLLGF